MGLVLTATAKTAAAAQNGKQWCNTGGNILKQRKFPATALSSFILERQENEE